MKQLFSAEILFTTPYKKAQLFLLLLCIAVITRGQITNISGIVNTYHKVIEIIPAKACLRVADPTGLNLNTLVMVVQMKGASVSTANNSTFGDTASLNGAGNYEVGAICHITGDSVFLFHQLMNTYDVSAKVQIVQFSQQYSTTVVDTVKAARWDSATGLGGVIAIFAEESITMNAPIYADSGGYSGGAYIHHAGNCPFAGTGFVYDASAAGTNNGAYKGEGVAILSATQDGAKGAPANGGGGGNNHNNSGAGGANLSAGGNGGGNSSSGPFGCNTGGNYGRAGKALGSWGGTKLFMGGGGGAGHSNNGAVTTNFGGNGGGIVFIWATTLIGNGHTISARGGNGGSSQSDGAGGGGAGGTVVLNVDTYTGPATVNVNGGNGGSSDDGNVVARCFGGGGGGSAGAVYFEGATPALTVSITGGSGGNETNRDGGCNAAVPGAAGSDGQIIPNYTFSRSTTTAGYCLLLLPVKLFFFKAQLSGRDVMLNWKVENPELARSFTVERKGNDNTVWVTVYSVNAGDDRFIYSAADRHPVAGNNFYRLKITEKNNSVFYSETKKVWIPAVANDFEVYPNPARDKVTIAGNFESGTQIHLTDIAGKKVWQQNINAGQAEIQLPMLQQGIYFIRYKEMVKKLLIYR